MFKTLIKMQSAIIGVVAMPLSVILRVLLWGTTVSLLRNPFTSLYKGFSMILNRGEMLAKPILRLLPDITDQSREGDLLDDILDEAGLPDPIMGEIEFLIDGESFFNKLHQAVKEAKKTVDSRVFIFDNDETAVAYADLLKSRSKDLECRVLLDELGSLTSWFNHRKGDSERPDSMLDYLREGGSKVHARRSLNPFLVADHAKLFVIDKETAFLGGMNIGNQYHYDWHDMMVRVTGPIVKALQHEFNRAWGLQGGWGDWKRLWESRKGREEADEESSTGIPLRILTTRPWKKEIEVATVAAIKMSRKRVYVQNAYFTSDPILEEMIAAKKRGADVRMIFPSDNDSLFLELNNNSVTAKLLNAGIQVYKYPCFSHIKAMVADDFAIVGSANLDTLSLRINEELSISFSDRKTVDELVRDLFEKDFESSTESTEMDIDLVTGSIMETIADQL